MTEPDEEYSGEELRSAISETLHSLGWVKVAVPALERALADVGRRLLDDRHTLEEMRGLQGEAKVLRRLIEKPREVFKPGVE